MGLGSIIFKEWRVTRTFSYTSTFMNIARNTLSVEYHILSRELAMKNENGRIFINRIQEILEKYGLGKVEEYLHGYL